MTISGNRIDESFIYAVFVSNAVGVRIADNIIGRTFVRGSAFDAGGLFGLRPNSAIFLGMVQDAEVVGNTAARGPVAKHVLAVDRTCDRASIRVGRNQLV